MVTVVRGVSEREFEELDRREKPSYNVQSKCAIRPMIGRGGWDELGLSGFWGSAKIDFFDVSEDSEQL